MRTTGRTEGGTEAMYDVTGALPIDSVSTLEAGSSVLVAGPAMTGKQALAIDLLTSGVGRDEGVLWIATSRGRQGTDSTLVERCDRAGGGVGYVDCSGSSDESPVEPALLERVSSPSDLTGISIATAKLQSAFAERDVQYVRHGLHSVSTLVHYLDAETVFKFLHIFTNRVADLGDVGVFTLDTDAHDTRTVSTISSEFDAVIEVRETESGERQVRSRGFGDSPSQWTAY